MDDLDLPKIVSILIENESLVQDWRRFYDALEVRDPRVVQWTNDFNRSNLLPYGLFMNILHSWKYEKGSKVAILSSLCRTLRDIQKVSVAECLEVEFNYPIHPRLESSCWFNVGQVSKYFVGRKAQLDKLQQIYQNKTDKIILISGLGGIGKTELTKKFAHILNNKVNANCTWFNGETEESFQQSLVHFALTIGLKIEDKSGRVFSSSKLFNCLAELMCISRKYKCISKSWLIIFDNVDELNSELLSCLQQIHETENAMAILTSRNQTIAEDDMYLISLEEWEPEDAKDFVKLSLNLTPDFNDISIIELCHRLGNHALAMQQAVAYIIKQQRNSLKGKSYSISDYLNEFDEEGRRTSKLLDHKLSQISHKFAKTTFMTWDITISKIKSTDGFVGKIACKILETIAYFNPDSIKLCFLKKFSKLETKQLQPAQPSNECIEEAVELLKAYSLIKIENCVISIHRLVQEVIRIKMKSLNKDSFFLTQLVDAIQTFSPTAISRSELPHVQKVWRYSSSYVNLIQTFPNIPLVIFKQLVNFGLVSEMFNFATWNHKRLSEVLGENHVESSNMEHNLATALWEKGEWVKSLEIYSRVWAKRKEILGEEHEETLRTANNMTGVLSDLKRFDEAKTVQEKVLGAQKKTLGESHPDTVTTKHNLARVLIETGELDCALGMYNEVLDWRRKELGDRHPDTLATRNNIAVCLFKQGKYWEAKPIFEDISEFRKTALGEEHPNTLSSMHMLVLTLSELPASEDHLLTMAQHILSLRKKILGVNHPHTWNTQKLVNKISGMFFRENGKNKTEGFRTSYNNSVNCTPQISCCKY